MESQELIRMANQIADFFKSYPEEEAIVEVAKHLKSFWEPRMLAKLMDAMEQGGGTSQLDPIVVASARRLGDRQSTSG